MAATGRPVDGAGYSPVNHRLRWWVFRARRADHTGRRRRDPDITVGDNFYKPNEFRVRAGEQVTLKVKNEGQAVHTVRLAGPDGRYETDDDTTIDPPMIKPGQSVSLVWAAPTEPGPYLFRCDYHPEETGTITVE